MRQDLRATALVLALVTTGSSIILVRGLSCFDNGAVLLAASPFLLLTAGYVWIASEILRVTSETLFRRALATSQTLSAAVALHFIVGAAGFALYTDVPSGEGAGTRFLTWVPFWTLGLLFKLGRYTMCE